MQKVPKSPEVKWNKITKGLEEEERLYNESVTEEKKRNL